MYAKQSSAALITEEAKRMGFQQGPCDTIEGCTMAMPQRDETIEEIKRLDALLEYAVMHEDEAEAARRRAELPPSL